MTKDHIPPEGFFPPDAKHNLLTVDCCLECNKSFSLDDEAVRVWLTSTVHASYQGRWIWENKVLHTLDRSPKLRGHVRSHTQKTTIKTALGEFDRWTVAFPATRFNRFVTRICRGLLRHHYPHFDSGNALYRISMLTPESPDHSQILQSVLPLMHHGARGDTVFNYWHGFAEDNPDRGLIVVMFYFGSCWFIAFEHRPIGPAQGKESI